MDQDENKRLEDLAGELVDTPPEVEVDDVELPKESTPEQIAKAEGLLQQASLAKIRGQGAVAERFLKDAAEAAPGSAAVHAALGDQLWERSQFSKARNSYKFAHKLEPTNPSYETKWAESLVGSMGNPLAMHQESFASAKIATMLSVFCPGLGQIVSGNKSTGIFMLVVWVGGWAVFIPSVLGGLPDAVGSEGTKISQFSTLSMVSLGVLMITWIWSVTSANSGAKQQRMTQSKRIIEHPAPPGDGDFEM